MSLKPMLAGWLEKRDRVFLQDSFLQHVVIAKARRNQRSLTRSVLEKRIGEQLLRTVLCGPVSGLFGFFTSSKRDAILGIDVVVVGAAGPVIDLAVFVSAN